MSKKLLFFAAFAVISISAQAQITLGSADWPVAGTSATIYRAWNDTIGNLSDSIDVGVAGAAGDYDFTKLMPFVQDTFWYNFMTPASFPFGGSHPGTEVGYISEWSIDSIDTIMIMHTFLDSDSDDLIQTGLTIVIDTAGQFSGNPTGVFDTVNIVMSADDTLITSADTFMHTDTEWAAWDVSIGNFYHTESWTRWSEVDGYGTFWGPLGTAPALRVKCWAIINRMDSTVGNPGTPELDTNYWFEYWGNGQGWKLASVSTDSAWTSFWDIEMLEYAPVSTGKYSDTEFSLYPNPNAGKFTITLNSVFNENGTWVIYNCFGQTVASKEMTAGTREIEMNLESTGTGVYYAVFQDAQKQNLAVKKFIMTR